MAWRQHLVQAWQQRGLLACLMWPVSLVYGVLARAHAALYAVGLLTRHRLQVPVLVVGNVVVGGAGKTPVVIALVQHLQAQGWHPGVISRGYGRARADCLEVCADSSASQVGDEPLLIQRKCQVPVFVAAKRFEAAQALLQRYPNTDIVISDDGLQHHALHHDWSVCVFDERGVGNGWLLPAGPLRGQGGEVTWILHSDASLQSSVVATKGAYPVKRSLAPHALRADGSTWPLDGLKRQPLHAVAGIARPERFFAMLRDQGLTLEQTTALPDHADFESYPPSTDQPKQLPKQLICTEKDAVKLWRHCPQALAVPLCVTLDAEFLRSVSQTVHVNRRRTQKPKNDPTG